MPTSNFPQFHSRYQTADTTCTERTLTHLHPFMSHRVHSVYVAKFANEKIKVAGRTSTAKMLRILFCLCVTTKTIIQFTKCKFVQAPTRSFVQYFNCHPINLCLTFD